MGKAELRLADGRDCASQVVIYKLSIETQVSRSTERQRTQPSPLSLLPQREEVMMKQAGEPN